VARQISGILELPILLVACVAVGGGLGFFLDQRIHTSPLFTLIFGALGFAAGMIQLVKRLSKDTKDNGGA
jgi:F0F1-type ATP synthase assembly protein I